MHRSGRMFLHFGRLAAIAVAGLALSACGGEPPPAPAAELVLANGRIHTVDPATPWAQSVAIGDGRIVAVGSDAEVARWKGPQTRVVDLQGRLVLPAFADAHAHPLFGAVSRSGCPLHDGGTLGDYQRIIAGCMEESPGDTVIHGVGWSDALFPLNGVPRKEVLDAVSRDRPLIFESIGGHTLWLNSRALEMAGITRHTPDPANGHIDRDPETGEAVGGLQEAAMGLVADLVPGPAGEDREQAIVDMARTFNSLGITGWHDAGVDVGDGGNSEMIDAYGAVLQRGELNGHVAIALKWNNARGLEQLPDLVRASERADALGLVSRSVKFYLDGVIPQHTALMLAPYENARGDRGSGMIARNVLQRAVAKLDARGFQVHIHAIGDGAVRMALDAFEAARTANGPGRGRHMISHLNVVDPEDQPRFGELGVAAQFQPLWATNNGYMDLARLAIGPERSGHIYPAGSILEAGGMLAYGADWPVGSADPLKGLEVAVTRTEPDSPGSPPLLSDEAVDLEQAVRAYTLNVAYVNRMDSITGSIVAGKSADLVVLDRNIFDLAPAEVSSAKVLLTLFKGRPVSGSLDGLDLYQQGR